MPFCQCCKTLSITHGIVAYRSIHPRNLSTRSSAVNTRRSFSFALGLLVSGIIHSAQANDKDRVKVLSATEVEDRVKTLRSAAGFEFVYPSSWIVAFERGDSMKTGVIALVGNFLSVDTFSVERKPLNSVQTGEGNLKSIAQEAIRTVRESPTSIAFKTLNEGYIDTRQGTSSIYFVEYDTEVCKGLISESLGGKKECKDAKDNDLQTVQRHHLLGVTQNGGTAYYLNGSCPSTRWEVVKDDLWFAMRNFMSYKVETEKSK